MNAMMTLLATAMTVLSTQDPVTTTAKLPDDRIPWKAGSTVTEVEAQSRVSCPGTLRGDQILATYVQDKSFFTIHYLVYEVSQSDPEYPYEDIRLIWKQQQYLPTPDSSPEEDPEHPNHFDKHMWFYMAPVTSPSGPPYFEIKGAFIDKSVPD